MHPSELLEFDWEVGVFRAVRRLWRRMFPTPAPYDPTRAAVLSVHEGRLRILAQLVAGEAVRVLPARTNGGIRGRDLLVPPWIDAAADPDSNRGLLLLRVVHAAAMRRVTRGRTPPADPREHARATLQAVDDAFDLLAADFPNFADAWRGACEAELADRPKLTFLPAKSRPWEALSRAMLRGERPWSDPAAFVGLDPHAKGPPVRLWGEWFRADLDGHGQGADAPEAGGLPEGTEVEAPAVEELRRVILAPEKQAEKVVTHSFEKIETLDASEGNTIRDDGSDELESHLEALNEVDLRDLTRGGQDAASIYKADLDLDADIPDVGRILPGETGLPYDEWDFRTRQVKKDWCTVYPTPVRSARPAWAVDAVARNQRLIARLRDRLGSQRSELVEFNRQLDGEHPDIAALVDHLADVQAGRNGDGRLYTRRQRHRRDVATTVLLDISLSTDAWVANRRVLDVAREAVVVLGEVADSLGDRLQILAFASETRNRCRVFEVKGWQDSWSVARGRLGALEPQGYTRIGPAVRHATRGLAAVRSKSKVLLLVSDGKPNDYDKYEGHYGVADVRHSLHEAEAVGVFAHALAIDQAARAWLPAMFGLGHWHVLRTPDALLDALTEVYGRCTAR